MVNKSHTMFYNAMRINKRIIPEWSSEVVDYLQLRSPVKQA